METKLPMQFEESKRLAILSSLIQTQNLMGEALMHLQKIDEATNGAALYELQHLKDALVGCARMVEEVTVAEATIGEVKEA